MKALQIKKNTWYSDWLIDWCLTVALAVFQLYYIYISWRVDNYKSDVYKDENTISRLKHRLVEQELLTLPEHLSSPPVFSGFVLLDL
jgi:hypothetical protein